MEMQAHEFENRLDMAGAVVIYVDSSCAHVATVLDIYDIDLVDGAHRPHPYFRPANGRIRLERFQDHNLVGWLPRGRR